ncbi:MAG: hypothetical protein KDB01_22780, partial [Planctomycetaceae bacterium]|nr:hypothetical protein [Planctomycetaceae bacterium]
MFSPAPVRRAHAGFCILVSSIWAILCTGLIAQVDFNREVRPILSEHCYQCHGPDAKQRGGDLRLDLEAGAKESAIIAGSAADSALIQRIESHDPELRMPPAATGKVLTAEHKAILRQWIEEGAKYSNHWAFQPVADSEVLVKSLLADES